MKTLLVRSAVLLAAVAAPSAAFAHAGHADTVGFTAGFAHPLGGLDHVLAMVAVGLFAFQIGGRALWMVPAAFVAFMGVGGGLGMAGVDLPFVEAGIALSVAALGALVALRLQWSVAAAAALVAAFAVFHGHAHGAEMPEAGSALGYAAGFILATALLHGAGMAAGLLLGKVGETNGGWVARGSGAAAACVGVLMLAGQI